MCKFFHLPLCSQGQRATQDPWLIFSSQGCGSRGTIKLLWPRVLTSPIASCIHGVLLLWREQPGGGTGGGGLLAQGLVQTAMVSGQHASHIRRHCHQACQASNRMAMLVDPGSLPKVPSCDKELAAFARSPLVVTWTEWEGFLTFSAI